jgi:dihydrofolate reductase
MSRKLIESTFVSLDGVISEPQNWGPPYWDDEHAAYASKLTFAADTLLLGRATYDVFAQSWPSRGGEYADRLNAMPKIVASRSLSEGGWNAEFTDDPVATVTAAKAEDGQSILKFGTGELDKALLEAGLIDELHLWVFPVVAGGGTRLLEGIDMTHLELVESHQFASGIVVHVCSPK